MWETVRNQERAVAMLERASRRPGHAYLLVGPRGSGVEHAIRCFAAALIGVSDDERSVRLALRGAHPDVVEFEPTTNTYTLANEIREPRGGETYRRDRALPRVIPEIFRAPIEGDRKVVWLRDADRMSPEVANALLKSIEEPPPRTVVLLSTERPDALLDTVRSRCQRIDFAYVVDAPSEASVELRAAFAAIPSRVDGTGATAVVLGDELIAAVEAASAAREALAEAELAELEEQIERSGYPARTASALRRRLADRHKQELRRAREDALAEGIGAIESTYLAALSDPERSHAVDAGAAGRALDACREARDAFEFNPREGLLVQRLVLHLPPEGAVTTR